MAGKEFLKVKFIQSTELGGVGYSCVGGPARDGVYESVPASVLEASDYAAALAKDGLLEVLGEGDSPETASTAAPRSTSGKSKSAPKPAAPKKGK